ncbi:MAG: hypothetical protein ACRDEA_14275 [Microcystaceae cyanobacterium]
MKSFLYEKSVSYPGNLIIPFIYGQVGGEIIYSYVLLSEQSYKSQLHEAENPAGLYSNTLDEIIDIAKKHLEPYSQNFNGIDYFRERYTYQDNLIIIHQEAGKCFYDHYPPHELRNVAAPKLFNSVYDCINWVKQGLDRQWVR